MTKDKALSAFIGDWKKFVSRKINQQLRRSGVLWQPEFFDHLMRSPSSYQEKWHYILQNPVRAGLVSETNQWPYQGEIDRLEVREEI